MMLFNLSYFVLAIPLDLEQNLGRSQICFLLHKIVNLCISLTLSVCCREGSFFANLNCSLDSSELRVQLEVNFKVFNVTHFSFF